MTTRLLALLLVLVVSGCASWPRRWGAAPCCIETKPVVRRQPIWWHLFDVTVLEPLEGPFHLIRPAKKWAGVPTRALNLREGRVADSAFFTDRDPAELSPEQVRWGPTRPGDEAVAPLVITKSKTEGKTSGFFATDARGRRYLLKLDPVAAPELLSGAEVVASKLLHALGYRVPSYEVLTIPATGLRVALDAVMKAPDGGVRPLTQADLDGLLDGRLRGGAVRVAASELIAGEILGPARFKQFRDCAEIRALRLAYAWLNNIDTKDHNSLLVWDGTRTLGYLIDFGTSLGADAGLGGPKHPCAGWNYIVDLREASLELLTLGLRRSRCPLDAQAVSPGVGLILPHVDPDRWKPYAPNVAFREMNDEDARWMSRRMARFSHAQLGAAVSAGRYSDPADAAYLVDVLARRRDDIVRRYVGGRDQ